MKAKTCLHILGLAAALATNVAAAGNWGTSSYTGLGYVDENQFNDESFSSSFSLVYRFTDTLGVEAGYTSFGDFKNSFDVGTTRAKAEASIDGFSLGLNVLVDVSDAWYMTGHVGMWSWNSDAKISVAGGPSVTGNGDGTDFFAGAGFGYKFTERWGAGLGATYYSVDVNNNSSGVYILGFNTIYSF
jgi:OmpA-OmpF porin, OOP family